MDILYSKINASQTIMHVSSSKLPPDRPCLNCRASKPGDRQTLCSSGTSCDIFFSSKVVKGSVGMVEPALAPRGRNSTTTLSSTQPTWAAALITKRLEIDSFCVPSNQSAYQTDVETTSIVCVRNGPKWQVWLVVHRQAYSGGCEEWECTIELVDLNEMSCFTFFIVYRLFRACVVI